jgi:2-polyprenyl-3-methyl-5-hydroxy-6-metoxy-1,4-benzoquinol methylase
LTAETAAYVPPNTRPYGGHEVLLRLAGSPRSVLDVGCSSGYLARRLVEQGAEVVGIDVDETAVAEARAFCTEVLVGDVETMELPFEPGSFDLVLCGDLIEHLRDPDGFLVRVRPLISPGGRLVLTTPNVANWTMRLSLLAGRWRYTDRGILDRTHAHLFTRKSLDETLLNADYEIVDFDVTAPVPRIGTPAVERLAHRIALLRPTLLAFQFVVAATPR